jgi:D-3-phosphoglycerate dehydrogenase
MRRRPKVLIQPIHEAGARLLAGSGCDVRVALDPSPAALARDLEGCQGFLVRTAPVPASLIEAAASLQVIARHGVGTDNVDLAAATRRKIPVCITPRANALSVAEHVIALMLALAKHVVAYDAAVRKGEWSVREGFHAVDLAGKTLGIIGMGRIGTLVCRKAKAAFDMDVLAYDPFIAPQRMEEAGAKVVETVLELLRASDAVTLHVPSSPGTKGLIGDEEIAAMKPTAFLINTARGSLVDEAALARALQERRIAGAGLDVFGREPPEATHPLFGLPNVVLTPHSAGLTLESAVRMATDAAQAIVDVLEGRRPEGVVNPEVFT